MNYEKYKEILTCCIKCAAVFICTSISDAQIALPNCVFGCDIYYLQTCSIKINSNQQFEMRCKYCSGDRLTCKTGSLTAVNA